MRAPPVGVGIEGSKAPLDGALRPSDDGWHGSHEAWGSPGLVERWPAVPPPLVVLEATGGLAVPVPGALAAAGRPVVGVPPRHAREVAPATGRVARPAADVAAALPASPRWRAQDERLPRTPGVGPIRSRPLVAEVPAVGALNRQESAALIGVAPFNRESGTRRGTRALWRGRAHGRAVLSMSPLAAVRHPPVLQACYARVRAVGKAPKVARTACMRQWLTMLNARLKPRTPWQENYATHA